MNKTVNKNDQGQDNTTKSKRKSKKKPNKQSIIDIKSRFLSKIAIVLFFDIVGFTKGKGEIEQAEIIIGLVDHLRLKFGELGRPFFGDIKQSPPDLLFSPTGDGSAIALSGNYLDGAKAIDVLDYVMIWSVRKKIKIRCGIHYGSLLIYEDINGNANFCGSAVNMAKRIMDTAQKHILCSRTGFDMLIGAGIEKRKNGWIHSPAKVYYVKHGKRVHLINLCKEVTWYGKKRMIGDLNMPTKYMSEKFEYLTDDLQEIQEDLLDVKNLYCIALTAAGLSKKIKRYLFNPEYRDKMRLEKIYVYLPTKIMLASRWEEKSKQERLEDYNTSISDFKSFREKKVEVIIRYLEFLPSVGLLGFDPFMDDEEGYIEKVERKIRMVVYIWGQDTDKSIYADFMHPGDDYLYRTEYRMFRKAIKEADKVAIKKQPYHYQKEMDFH
ncbi:MAG: hypothetical protein HQ568_06725 [Calditrichaeota bacterium]|nr:hypothetical protein [Calditrichota bacterium]